MENIQVNQWEEKLRVYLESEETGDSGEKIKWLVRHFEEYIGRWLAFAESGKVEIEVTLSGTLFFLVLAAINVINNVIAQEGSPKFFPLEEWNIFCSALKRFQRIPEQSELMVTVQSFETFWSKMIDEFPYSRMNSTEKKFALLIRFERTLNTLENYHDLKKDKGWLSKLSGFQKRSEFEDLLGVYINDKDTLENTVVFSDTCIYLFREKKWECILFSDMVRTTFSESKNKITGFELSKKDGSTFWIPITGSKNDRFFDVFQVIRYIDRILEIEKASRVPLNDMNSITFPVIGFSVKRNYFHAIKMEELAVANKGGMKNFRREGLQIIDSCGIHSVLTSFIKGPMIKPSIREIIFFNFKYKLEMKFEFVRKLSLKGFKAEILEMMKKHHAKLIFCRDISVMQKQIENASSYREIIDKFY
jgi:hypothetical protein